MNKGLPKIVVKPPGPKSRELWGRLTKHLTGMSGQASMVPVAFSSGRGCVLMDVDGNEYIDFTSGIYITSAGHCHPKVVKAICDQVAALINCHDFNTPIKVECMEKLASVTPSGLTMGQLFSGGAECIEAALRLAKAATGKKEFISFYNGFHGKTLAAMSLSEIRHPAEAPRAANYYRTPYGHCYHCSFKKEYPECDIYCVDFIKEVIAHQTTGNVAGIMLEPIQGWAGSIVPPDKFLPRLRELCDEMGMLLIADEILCGSGRTGPPDGSLWCSKGHYNVTPDILIMGKGIANGYPVTAFMTTEEIMEKAPPHAFSTSYGSNPVACAAVLASLEVIEEERLVKNASKVGKFILKRLKEIQEEHETVGEVRGKGLLLGMELVKNRRSKEPFQEAGHLVYRKAFEKGLAWVPAHQNLRMAPPLIMNEELADKGLRIIEQALTETEKELKGKYGDK